MSLLKSREVYKFVNRFLLFWFGLLFVCISQRSVGSASSLGTRERAKRQERPEFGANAKERLVKERQEKKNM